MSEMTDMTGVKVFQQSFRYLTDCVKKSVSALDDDKLLKFFKTLITARNGGHTIIVDGQGRSLQSLLLAEDCLEHNGFPIILPASNANLRPWRKNDIFMFNSGSGSGSTFTHAKAAQKDGLNVLGMSYNRKMEEIFPEVLILEPSKVKNPLYAPLGTEFELSSAVIGSCLGYAVNNTPQKSLKKFKEGTYKILDLYEYTYDYLEEEIESLMDFIHIISQYVSADCKRKVYFRGVGRDRTVNRVAAIRYGHLHKDPECDLQVIYEGHWDLREKNDLAIVTSGSGATSQTLDYAMQAFISEMNIFGITSFKESDLGKFSNRVNGCLVLPGRDERFSAYNIPSAQRKTYLPTFELNYYITLDALLSQVAANFNISEADMKASHRSKVLE